MVDSKRSHLERPKLLREAAAELQKIGLVSFESLARRVGLERHILVQYLRNYPKLQEELCISSDIDALVWNTAKKTTGTLTRISLAEAIGRHYNTIQTVLRRHPDWIDTLDIDKSGCGSGVRAKLGKDKK